MRTLVEKSERSIEQVSLKFVRNQINWIDQNERLIGIIGSRGVGKTTLLLQQLKIKKYNESAIYISLDDIYFAENKLFDFVDEFVKNGGKYLFIDEVHHYDNWAIELKNIYDTFKNLKIVYTGSSLLKLSKGRTDLSRRSIVYKLPGLSLREYINITESTDFPAYTINDITNNHLEISKSIWTKTLPIKKYNEYLKVGYYPFFLENPENYPRKLNNIILEILETDLPFIAGINYSNINKLKQLLYIISESAPFKPNIIKLSERIGISKNTLKDYLLYMKEALLINMLYTDKKGISMLAKPEKIYLHNPNIAYTLANEQANIGNVRETFFLNQVQYNYNVYYSSNADFMVDGKVFEIGGKNKSKKQIKNIDNSFLALDNIDTGYKNEIPLWLFGFLY